MNSTPLWKDIAATTKFQIAPEARVDVTNVPCDNMGICGGDLCGLWL
jgi:hypothetical protein